MRSQQLRQMTFVLRGQMNDDDVSDATVGRSFRKQCLQRGKATRRRANRDQRKPSRKLRTTDCLKLRFAEMFFRRQGSSSTGSLDIEGIPAKGRIKESVLYDGIQRTHCPSIAIRAIPSSIAYATIRLLWTHEQVSFHETANAQTAIQLNIGSSEFAASTVRITSDCPRTPRDGIENCPFDLYSAPALGPKPNAVAPQAEIRVPAPPHTAVRWDS